jgi:hypothetical protein
MMYPIRHYINLVEGSQSYKTQLLSTVYTQPITESMLMEDFGLSSLWEGLKKILGDTGDFIWGGIKKLASATVSMLVGVPGFIVKSAVSFMIWCAFNPITSILGYLGLKNPAAAANTINFLSAGITNMIGGDAGPKGVAAGATMGGALGADAGGSLGSVVPGAGTLAGAGYGGAAGAITGAIGAGRAKDAIDSVRRGIEGTSTAFGKLTPGNLAKQINGPEAKPGGRPPDALPPIDRGTQADYDDMQQGQALWDKANNAELPSGYGYQQPTIADQAQAAATNLTAGSNNGLFASVRDAATQINKWIGEHVTEEAIQSIANFVFNWGIPIVATAAIVYGGQLLYEYITTKTPPKITESKVAKVIKSSLAKHKAAGNVLGGNIVKGAQTARNHLNRNTVGAQAVPTAESMRAIINKIEA